MDIVVLILALLLLCFLAFKGIPTLFSGLFISSLLCLYFGMPIYTTLSGTYMSGLTNFVTSYMLMFLFGALFGKIMEVSGAADSIAETVLNLVGEKRVILGIALVSAILTVGGISIFVCIFAIFPIANKMCKRTNMPREFVVLGNSVGSNAASFAPFVPSVNNVVAATAYGTAVGAAAVPGLIVSVLYFIAAWLYVEWMAVRWKKKGRTFVPTERDIKDEEERAKNGDPETPHFVLAILPIIFILVVLNVFSVKVVPALFYACVVAVICQIKYLPHKFEEIKKNLVTVAQSGVITTLNTAGVVGFGTVVAATAGYITLQGAMNDMGGNALFSTIIVVTVLAGICGSASGGLSLATTPVVQNFLTSANAAAITRVSVIASFGLDSLPNNGFLQTKFAVCGVEFKDAYPGTFVITVLFTVVAAFVCAVLCMVMGLA